MGQFGEMASEAGRGRWDRRLNTAGPSYFAKASAAKDTSPPKGLTTLKTLDLTGSSSLQNVDGVRSALPLSKIIYAEGTISFPRAE
jgi:hypothetical protein